MDPGAVFKAYDIRGRTDTGQLDEKLYELVGSALVELLAAPRIAVGRDCRPSSPLFFEALVRGITGAGSDVFDIGEVPTDAVYYFSGARGVPGAMITASHNPPGYNGLKLCRAGAVPIGAETGLATIREKVESGAKQIAEEPGSVTTVDVVDDYVRHLLDTTGSEEIGRLRVAVDGGNGMAGVAVERVFARIDAELEGLYLEPDGTFPNHPADPLVPENLADLTALVARGGFDLGVAFDGDADRAFFLDDEAKPLSGSTVTSLIARSLLADYPGAAVVHNLITSRAVPEIVTEAGGIPVRTRVGHSFIKQVMADTDAVFGGEHSGHYYFRDNFRADSGMMAMLVLMRVLSESGQPMSQLRKEVERYAASGEINFEVDDQAAAMAEVEADFPDAEIDHLDGLTVDLGGSWLNLRPSNTEPLLRLNVEAGSSERVAELVARVRRNLQGQ
ncbi:MAG: phosphomannomutase/phosphoglucomutase [Actinobacteria bacterium]|nr:phosphomannomutase/phosphoglucomutase [Actinomycetota bacterium]